LLPSRLQKPLDDEKGQGLAEYGMIILLVAFVAVAAMPLLGNQISGIFSRLGGWFSSP